MRDISAAEQVEVAEADQDRPGAGQAHAELTEWEGVSVLPAGAEVRPGLVEIFVIQGQELFLHGGREENFGEQFLPVPGAGWAGSSGRASNRTGGRGDVHELEAFAETDAIGDERLLIQPRIGEQMGAADAGPEFADAAGDAIGVVVQLGGSFEGDDLVGRGFFEAMQVQFLAAGDGEEDVTDKFQIGG